MYCLRGDDIGVAHCTVRKLGLLHSDAPDVLMYPRIEASARAWRSARAVICGSGAAAAKWATAATLNNRRRAIVVFGSMQGNNSMRCDGNQRKTRGKKGGHYSFIHFSLTALGCSIACLLACGLSLPSLMTEVAHLHQFFHLEKYVVASQRASSCVYLHEVSYMPSLWQHQTAPRCQYFPKRKV